MSNRPQNRVERRFKALIRWAEYQASKSILWARNAKPERKVTSRLTFAERYRFRRWLWWKYGPNCAYCGKFYPLISMTIDHVQPVSRGGPMRDIQNMALACIVCNKAKGHKWDPYAIVK